MMKAVEKQCKVLVVGGGIAGIAAAVTAAREGAQTILVERRGYPGGSAVAGLHSFICGLYANGPKVPEDTLNGGLAREICLRLKTLSPEKTPRRMGKVYVLPFATEDIISVFQSFFKKERRYLEVLYNVLAVSVETTGNAITGVLARGPKGVFNIIPEAVVDCSGNGIIAELSGASVELSPLRQRQFAGYAFRVKGLWPTDNLSLKVSYCMARAVTEGKVPFYLKFTTFASGGSEEEGICKISIPSSERENRDRQARNDALTVYHYLQRILPPFKDSQITEMSSELLDREGPRIRGEYMLTADDVLNARKFADGAVRNAWPIELWDQRKGPQYRYLIPDNYYEIPVRCLKAREISNLYCAGRCISVSREALGSTRVMGTCFSLGEQAGYEAVS